MIMNYHLGPRSPPENTLPDHDLLAFGSQGYSTAYLLSWLEAYSDDYTDFTINQS